MIKVVELEWVWVPSANTVLSVVPSHHSQARFHSMYKIPNRYGKMGNEGNEQCWGLLWYFWIQSSKFSCQQNVTPVSSPQPKFSPETKRAQHCFQKKKKWSGFDPQSYGGLEEEEADNKGKQFFN